MNEIIKKENLSLKELKDKYLDYIDVSDNTVKTYDVGLLQFFNYLQGRNIKQPTREDIISFREYLQENHKPTTINSYMIAVRNFFNWLEYEGITKNITKNIKGIKVGNEHKRESLTAEQCKTVLNAAKDIREKVIFLLATTCGIRANELVNIRISDFKEKQDNICLYLLGKGRDYKQDYVIITPDIFELIKQYVQEYNITDYLFVSTSNNNKNGMITTKTVRLIIKNMFKRVGIVGDEYSCHSLRHTFATLSIKSGEDIREVSQALRHKNLQTTMIYLHDLEMINNKCSSAVVSALLG